MNTALRLRLQVILKDINKKLLGRFSCQSRVNLNCWQICSFCEVKPRQDITRVIIIHQAHYEKSDWSRAFNQFTIACELDMINALSAADIAFITPSSTSAWLLSPLECSPLKQNGKTLRFCFWGWIMWKMYSKTITEFGFRMISWIIKTSCLCYLPQPSASADNILTSVLIIHDIMLSNNYIYLSLWSWAGGILRILQSDWFRERTVFSYLLTTVTVTAGNSAGEIVMHG